MYFKFDGETKYMACNMGDLWAKDGKQKHTLVILLWLSEATVVSITKMTSMVTIPLIYDTHIHNILSII
jgi:hypothetical protein